ncbi:MAG: hypothetical protein EBX52_10260 [Proteobacteria bacterium]|nr:hypothetical protein [Pseudomonadota bacterium]
MFCVGMLPAAIWLSFHSSAFVFSRGQWAWVSGLGALFAAGFTFLMTRGFFAVRHLFYLATAIVLSAELLSSVANRDFAAMAGALLFLSLGVFTGLWLERRSSAAALNPECEWFEGAPKGMGAARVELGIEGNSVTARIRRLDFEGLFVFLDSPIPFIPGQRVRVKFHTEGEPFEGDAFIAASFSGDRPGLGLQFSNKDLYHSTRYTGWVQRWRGKGL